MATDLNEGYLPLQSLQNMDAGESTPPDIKPALEPLSDGDTSTNNIEAESQTNNYVYKCIFCDVILSGKDEPKILECLHNACGSCLQQVDNPQCTQCECFIESQNVLDNQFLIELHREEEISAKLAEVKCSSCSDDALATSWCVDCAEFICDNCVSAHQRLKITKDHTIKAKEEGLGESQMQNLAGGTGQMFCTVHPHEKLSLFCEYCDKLTCRDCQLTEHRDHKYKFTHEIAADSRRMIDAMLTDISYKRVLLNSAMKVIEDRQTLISDKKQSLINEITNMVFNLTNAINMRGKQLVARLSEVCDTKQKTLDEKKVALDQLSKITDHCIQFTRNVLDNGSDNALLYSKRHLTKYLQRIKSRRADIPNPEVPVRIHLALDKVPDLLKVVSHIGQIVVDGRVYPNQSLSPNALPVPQNAPSPRSPNHLQQGLPTQQPPPPPPGPPVGNVMPPSTSYMTQSRMVLPYGNYRHMGPISMPPNRPPPPPNVNISQQMHAPPSGISPMSLQQQMQRMPHPQMPPVSQQPPPPSQRQPYPRAMMAANLRLPTNSLNNQVTSSTHPQGSMHERSSLRGLLQPNGSTVYVQTRPGQYQAFPNRFPPPYQQQQQQQRMPPNQMHSRMYQQQLMRQQQQQATTKWHMPPEHVNVAYNTNKSTVQGAPIINNNFKIMLKSQVSSTIPKTPSPNQPEKHMDEFCEDSVNDLMATIAKLDSNGVQVLSETGSRGKTGERSPLVDSSTGDSTAHTTTSVASNKQKSSSGDSIATTIEAPITNFDPNEDWCAVCMDGGELVCCDRCPKVFHQFCHIPNLSIEESGTWQCLLCMNFADLPNDPNDVPNGGLTTRQKKVVERIVLELYCQYEPSLPFREVIGPENTAYHEIIKHPIALDTIRQKLDWKSPNCYTALEQVMRDVRLMFRNAYLFNPIDTSVYNDAKTLEKFFDEQLEKWLPEYAYEMFDDDEFQPPNKKYRRIICD